MTASTMRNTVQDAQDLLTQEAAEFLRYVVEVAAPIHVDEADEKFLEAFREWYEVELDLQARLVMFVHDLGEAPAILEHPLELGYYNFARAEVLANRLAEMCLSDVALLEGMQQDYAGCEDFHERQLLALMNDYLAQRKGIGAGIEKLAHGAETARVAEEAQPVAEEVAAVVQEAAAPALDAAGEDYPWHDEDLEISERMELAKSGSKFEKLFAAMAQTDCTACGYDCEGYARAIADGEESDISLCSPGGDETLDVIKELVA